ncbi:hypothetical protein [Salmonella enterica]|uniref:hypothetical protein n=1 Tax=Salmonella enterica TaxID=28901 RepID=UPI003CF6FE3A
MTTNNHPAHGPVSLDRLHQISEILSKASAQSDGGNLGYAMADARVRGRIKSISANRCGKCGYALPVESCPCDGDSACWVTRGWHDTKLSV